MTKSDIYSDSEQSDDSDSASLSLSYCANLILGPANFAVGLQLAIPPVLHNSIACCGSKEEISLVWSCMVIQSDNLSALRFDLMFDFVSFS